jgi:hypothetical protein
VRGNRRRRQRELGHRGGKSRRKGVAAQLPETERRSLREFLRDGLDHETIKTAIERALAGGNESARVAAVKFLADLELYKKGGDEEDRAREIAKANAEAAARFDELIARKARAHERGQVRDALDELAEWLRGQAVDAHPDLIVGAVSPERCEAVLEGLEQVGLLVRPSKVEELAEARALELLQAMKAEHGIPA